jgi:hypothetical protein
MKQKYKINKKKLEHEKKKNIKIREIIAKINKIVPS